MSLKLSGLLFSGPFDPADTIVRSNKPACVFAVISREGKPYDPRFRVIDIGDTAGQTVAFRDNPRLDRWRQESTGELGLYFYRPDAKEPQATRLRQIAINELIAFYAPPNGIVAMDGAV